MAKYLKIDPNGDICIADKDGEKITLEVNGDTRMTGSIQLLADDNGKYSGDLSVAGNLTVGGVVDGNLSVDGTIHTENLRVIGDIASGDNTSDTLSFNSSLALVGNRRNIEFTNAVNSRIQWTSGVEGTDRAYLLYLANSSLVCDDGEQCSRFSIGVHNNYQAETSIQDVVDIQGGAKLVLNAGVYDREIIDEFYGPNTNLSPAEECDIEFRINDVVEARVDRDGMHATDFITLSDASLKTDIRPLDDPLSKLLSLRGVLYKWKNRPSDSPDQIGLIAQEVEPYFPEIVVTDVNGLKSVRYSRLVVPLIEVLRTLCLEIEGLKQRIDN